MEFKIVISDREFNKIDEVQDQISDLQWEYNRIGGCGSFSFNVPAKFCRALIFGLNFNVKIYRRNPTTDDYDLWYQGRIEGIQPNVRGEDEITQIVGMGYQSQLSDIYVDRNYSSQEVSVIVKSILDNDVVPNTDITYSIGDLTATSVTPDTLTFNTEALSCMQTLSDLVGTREWGVDANRKFFFKTRSSAVGFYYPISKNLLNFSGDDSSRELANRIVIIGGETGGVPYSATFNDTNSQNKWRRRDKVIQNSAITTSAVATQFATAQFAEFSDVVRRARVDILDDVQIEASVPIPLFRIIPRLIRYGEMRYGQFLYSGHINYQVNRVQYRIDDSGNLTKSIQLGQLRPSVAEDINLLNYQIDQLRQQGV